MFFCRQDRRRRRRGQPVGGVPQHWHNLQAARAGAQSPALQQHVSTCPSGGRSGGAGGEKNLSAAFRGISAICERLGLVRVIKDRACELFKQVGHIPDMSWSQNDLSPAENQQRSRVVEVAGLLTIVKARACERFKRGRDATSVTST